MMWRSSKDDFTIKLEIKESLSLESMEQFWRGILENEVSHNQWAKWFKDAETSLDIVGMTLEEIENAKTTISVIVLQVVKPCYFSYLSL